MHVHHLYCNREEITTPLSIAKCYHHSKVLLCGNRYCYRHCTGTVCTGTVPVLYRYAYGGILYWYRYYDAVPVCLYGYTSNCIWLPVLPPPTHYTVTGNFMRWRPGNFMASGLVINRFSEHGYRYILVCAP